MQTSATGANGVKKFTLDEWMRSNHRAASEGGMNGFAYRRRTPRDSGTVTDRPFPYCEVM